MSAKDDLRRPRVFGSTVVGPRGQVVIPANARKELGIDSGDTLLACGPPHGQALLLLKIDAVEEMLEAVSEQLATFGKQTKRLRDAEGTRRKVR